MKKIFVILIAISLSFSLAGLAMAVYLPDTDLPTTTIEDIIVNAINWLVTIVAIVSVLVIVIAGFLWATAASNEKQVEDSRKWIIGAVGGLIVALAAWAIIYVVTSEVFI